MQGLTPPIRQANKLTPPSSWQLLSVVQKLLEERALLSQRRDSFTQLLEEINSKYKDLKTKLQENETHTQVHNPLCLFSWWQPEGDAELCVFQLANLEKKWQHLEKNNFVMKECILPNHSSEK